nr:MAG TPA: hypothetical protein [Bacteriophage sp.]
MKNKNRRKGQKVAERGLLPFFLLAWQYDYFLILKSV